MDEKAILKVLTDANVGDTIKVHFKPGQGKKGTLSSDERVAFLRFAALAGIHSGNEPTLTPQGNEALVALELIVVAQSGYWDRCSRERSFTVTRKISATDATFFAERIGPVLEEFALISSLATASASV